MGGNSRSVFSYPFCMAIVVFYLPTTDEIDATV